MRPLPGLARAFALLLLCAAGLSPALAQKTAKEAEAIPEFDRYRPFRHPGDKHKALDAFEGKWEAAITAWLHGTPPPKVAMKATLDNQWVYGRRFVQGRYTLAQVEGEGKDAGVRVTGEYLFGHHNEKGEYFNYFFADDHVIPTVSTGSFDPAAKVFTFTGGEHDPVTGDDFAKIEIFRLKARDEIGYELRYRFADGTEIKAAEGTFRRVP